MSPRGDVSGATKMRPSSAQARRYSPLSVTLAWVQVRPERYQTTGQGAPSSACGGTKTEKVMSVPVQRLACLTTCCVPPWARGMETVSIESVDDDRPDAFPGVHQVEGLVDVVERHGVGDERVDLDPSVHVPVDDARHVGAAAGAAERASFPDAAGDQLEGPGGDLAAGPGNAAGWEGGA